MNKKPHLDKATRELAERMLRMPPKPHEEMKVGKKKKSAKRKRRRNEGGE